MLISDWSSDVCSADLDRTGLGRGDAFLQDAHFLGQGGLVTHRRRHAAEQRRLFVTGQGVAVDVVDEQQHVLTLSRRVLLDRQTVVEGKRVSVRVASGGRRINKTKQ